LDLSRVIRIASLFVGALLLTVVNGAEEPYKRMLDDDMIFTGTETLEGAQSESEYRIGVFAPDDDDHPVERGRWNRWQAAAIGPPVGGGPLGRRI